VLHVFCRRSTNNGMCWGCGGDVVEMCGIEGETVDSLTAPSPSAAARAAWCLAGAYVVRSDSTTGGVSLRLTQRQARRRRRRARRLVLDPLFVSAANST
jgi:hypothetical protein